MDRFIHGAEDALRSYEVMQARLQALMPAKRFPPMPSKPLTGSTWAPKMTEAERKEFDQYVIDNNLPF